MFLFGDMPRDLGIEVEAKMGRVDYIQREIKQSLSDSN